MSLDRSELPDELKGWLPVDSSAWTGKVTLPKTRFLYLRGATLAFLPSTGVALTLSSGLCFGLRWRKVLTYTKVPRGNLRVSRRAGRGFFRHGPETTQAWEE